MIRRACLLLIALTVSGVPARADGHSLDADVRLLREGTLDVSTFGARVTTCEDRCHDGLGPLLARPENADVVDAVLDAIAGAADGQAAERVLLDLQREGPAWLRRAATTRLGDAGTSRSVGPLLEALGDGDVSAEAVAALGALAARDRAARTSAWAALCIAVNTASPERAEAALRAMALVDLETAGPRLLEQVREDAPERRRAGLCALVQVERARVEEQRERGEPLADDLARALLERFLDGTDVAERDLALRALRAWGDHGCVEALLTAQEGEPQHAEVVREVLRAVTREDPGEPAAWRHWWADAAVVWESYAGHLLEVRFRGPWARRSLAALGKIADTRGAAAIEGLVTELVRGAWTGDDVHLALGSCEALADLALPRGAGALIALLECPRAPEEVRTRALWALGLVAGHPGPPVASFWRGVFPDARVIDAIGGPEGPAFVHDGSAAPAVAEAPAERRPAASAQALPATRAEAEAPIVGGVLLAYLALTGLALLGWRGRAATQQAPPQPVEIVTRSAARLVTGKRITRRVAPTGAQAPGTDDAVATDDEDAVAVAVVLRPSGTPAAIVDDTDLSPPDAEDRRLLTHVLDALPALSAQLESLVVHLASAPERPWTAFRAGEGTSLDVAREALRGLEPLVTRAVVSVRGSALPFVVFSSQRAQVEAPPSAEGWRQLTETLCRTLPLFSSIEVYERGRLWRVVYDCDSTRGDAGDLLAALGALGPDRVEEVRARTQTQALASLYHRHTPTTWETSTWKGLVDTVHARAGSLRQLDVLEEPDDDAGWRPLFRAGDPDRAAAIPQRLPTDPASVRVVLAGTRACLTLAGDDTELAWAVDELAPFAAEIVAVETDGEERLIYRSEDVVKLANASTELLRAGHARVARVRAAWGEDEPFVLYDRASTAPMRAVARLDKLAQTKALRRVAA